MTRPIAALTALALTLAACGTDAATSVTLPAASTTAAVAPTGTPAPSTTAATTPPSTTPTTTRPAPTTTTPSLPDQPDATVGWSIESGDLLVANAEGVSIVRDGDVVAQPVTSPVEAVLADPRGHLLVTTPQRQGYPEVWPSLYAAASNTIWLVRTDGSTEALFTAADVELREAPVALHSIESLGYISDAPSLLFTVEVEGSPFPHDQVRALPLNGSTNTTRLPFATPGEGGVTGIGALGDGTFVMAIESDGGAALQRWTDDGVLWRWGTNPVPSADGNLIATTSQGPRRVVYAVTPFGEPSVIGVFDLDLRRDIAQVEPTVPETRTAVKKLHSDGATVAISRITWVQDGEGLKPTYLPVLLLDLETLTLTEVSEAGVGSLVP